MPGTSASRQDSKYLEYVTRYYILPTDYGGAELMKKQLRNIIFKYPSKLFPMLDMKKESL